MKYSLFAFFAIGFIACQSSTQDESTDNTEQNVVITGEETVDAEKPVLSDESPAGWVLAERFASDDNEYRFCPDGTLNFDNHYNTQMSGSWELKDDVVHLHYTTQINRVGIGEPLPMPPAVPGNYTPEYEDYEFVDEEINLEETLDWNEIRTFLKEDSLYPYQIMAWDLVCP